MMFEPKNQLLMNTFVVVDIIIVIPYILIKTCSLWIGRVLERTVIYLFYLNKEVKSSYLYIKISLKILNLVMVILITFVIRYGNYIVIDITKNKKINGKLGINWDRRVL